jgi:hypothetical protein
VSFGINHLVIVQLFGWIRCIIGDHAIMIYPQVPDSVFAVTGVNHAAVFNQSDHVLTCLVLSD